MSEQPIVYTREEANQLVSAYRASGLSIRAFSANNGIAYERFRWWVRRCNNEMQPQVEKPPFVQLHRPVSKKTPSVSEMELLLDFRSGTRLQWRGSELPESLFRLIASLESGVVQ